MVDDDRDVTRVSFGDDVVSSDTNLDEEAYLIVLAGKRVGEMIKIGRCLTIGRGEEADFQIVDDFISRVHVELKKGSDEGIVVSDLDSSNGTYINGRRITDLVLQDGDKIRLGSTTILKFSMVDNLDQSFQQHMYEGAVRDPLTGLYNRRHLMNHLETEFSYVTRHKTPLSLIMLDIDHFKRLNDTYGHVVGDMVLVNFADLLRSAIRTEDVAARYGGDEFTLVARGIPADIATTVAQRIVVMVETAELVPENPAIRVTVSAGVAGIPDTRTTEPKELIDFADKALYQAKNAGRNRVVRFE